MRLFTYQSLEVVYMLYKYSMYFASYEQSKFIKDVPEISFCFHWLMEQYNKKKKNEYSSAPVWWYTSRKEAISYIKYMKPNEVLLQADVPDKELLLLDSDLWETGPLAGMSLGWLGHEMYLDSDWKDSKYETLYDSLYTLYKKDTKSTVETWSEIFNIRKSDSTQSINAITPYIYLGWLQPIIKQKTSEI